MGGYSSVLLAWAVTGMGIPVTAFHSDGNCDVLRQELKRWHKLLLRRWSHYGKMMVTDHGDVAKHEQSVRIGLKNG